jgi:pyruvate carboxylase subunit B
MMRDNNMVEKFPDVIAAMSEVVRRGGFGTSVTPVSQFYFQQAFNNVVAGPWARIADGYGKMVLGYFGKTPVPPDPELVALASEQLGLEPTTRNPRELNDEDPSKGIEATKKALAAENLEITDESIFIASALKDKGLAFLKGERPDGIRRQQAEDPSSAPTSSNSFTVEINQRRYEVSLDGGRATINGRSYDYAVADGVSGSGATGSAAGAGEGTPIHAELSGQVLRVLVQEGDSVAEGDPLLVLEALKMEIEVKAPSAGRVTHVAVASDQQVNSGDLLLAIV